MSFPKGNSVNDGIKKDVYLDEQITLKYPTSDKLVQVVKRREEVVCCLSVIYAISIDKSQFVQKTTTNWELSSKINGTLTEYWLWVADLVAI